MKNFFKIIFTLIFTLCITGCSSSNKNDTFLYENKSLGFSMELPSVIEEKYYIEEESLKMDGEIINSIYVKYKGEENDSNIVTFEEMSQDYWEKMQQEEGPKPIELKKSENNRVVVMYPLQSNPFEVGTDDYNTINEFQEQSSCIVETFKFN